MALQRILCVDDDPDVRTLLEIGLSLVAGFDVVTCGSAREAAGAIEEFAPDLVILDDRMPITGGERTMKILQERSGLNDIPTIFLTALARPEDVDRLSACGAIAVISKPFDPMTLGDEIRRTYKQNAASIR